MIRRFPTQLSSVRNVRSCDEHVTRLHCRKQLYANMALNECHPFFTFFRPDATLCKECDELLGSRGRPGSCIRFAGGPSSRSCPACELWREAMAAFGIPAMSEEMGRSFRYLERGKATISISICDTGSDAAAGPLRWSRIELYAPSVVEKDSDVIDSACQQPRLRGLIETSHYDIRDCCPERGGSCLARVKEWLADCLARHPHGTSTYSPTATCSAHADPNAQLPSRVLLLPPDNANMAFLVETGGTMKGRYTALSYRWGEAQRTAWKTEAATLESAKRGISVSGLPKTMQDAIAVTKYLGIQYLWIDALCIVQDSPDDWALESGRMGAIYRDATLVISATDSTDCHGGLFFERESPRELPTESIKDIRLFARKARGSQHKTGTPTHAFGTRTGSAYEAALHSRAWAFQERFLATRTIHFGRDELGWSCSSVEACECKGIIPDDPLTILTRADFGISIRNLSRCTQDWAASVVCGSLWTDIVKEYTGRDLSHNTDRLPALSGVAETLSISGDQYAFGLWKSGIQSGGHLFWYPDDPGQSSPLQEHAPSWSWASIPGPIKFRDWGFGATRRHIFDLVELLYTPASFNPFGPGTGELKLRGYLIPIYQHAETESIFMFRTTNAPDYETMDSLASAHASDPDPGVPTVGKRNEHGELVVDTFGVALESRPESLKAICLLDVKLRETRNTSVGLNYLILVEVNHDDNKLIFEPEGIVLELVSLEGGPRYRRIGWGRPESGALYPTECWKTCGTLETVTIV
ncbi:heterokaryon incompatibility protein-domain-containing protein [Cercophora newfieldiana]|uniref:Heterokaryon incompatibility protein-domain-containing protein n=1 Tax=Cercophora newfieldiana TaxID=92897 RepID=A0AA39XQV5_9PEZI|nr:heterokaryon incompatibility protein-domain-containing protein [Cercophora newfieldiana]